MPSKFAELMPWVDISTGVQIPLATGCISATTLVETGIAPSARDTSVMSGYSHVKDS
tara:strand:- start:232 stop:402 length:171 start_codon:yes stop_codon:yes gene_type:complete